MRNIVVFLLVCAELSTFYARKIRLSAFENVENHFEIILDCLMKLPPYYLDLVEYGTVDRESSIRTKYIEQNQQKLKDDEKRRIIKLCDFSKLSYNECHRRSF